MLCSDLDACPRVLLPSCHVLDLAHDPSCSLQPLTPSAPCSMGAQEEDVFVVYPVVEEGLRVLV